MTPAEAWDPRLLQLLEYWHACAPPGRLPGRQHINPSDIPKLLPGIWLLDVQRDPFRLRYRLVGTRIVEAIGREVTGQWLDQAHPHVGDTSAFYRRYRAAVEQRLPSRRKGPATLWSHEDYRTIENIILPLAADGETVDMLLVLTVLLRADGRSVD